MFQNLFDSHTHSDNSYDGHDSIAMMCEAATLSNLSGFCITDHFECNIPDENGFIRLRDSMFEMLRAQAAFRSQVMLTCGIELGQATQNLPVANKALELLKYDFVIGSLHNIRTTPDFCELDFHQLNVPELLTQYYDEMLEMCQWGKFDALGHLTYPLRYIQGIQKIEVDMKPYEEVIREIMKTLISKDRAIEINTSTLRQGLGTTMPSFPYVKMFRELGGEYVTIGSDAHWAKDLGANISDGMEVLQEAGFKYFTVFRRREPKMLRIL